MSKETNMTGHPTATAQEATKPQVETLQVSSPPETPGKPKATVLEVHGYRIGKTLGYGSYAVVKEAFSEKHRMKVAIKIISKKRAPSDYIYKFLPREIEVVKNLKHPNLVTFYQSIETNNRVYLIMEMATHGDLLDVVKKYKRVEEMQAGKWFMQLLEGIEHMHGIGIVHRDLKCENLLLDNNENLKITDFGFARADMLPASNGKSVLSETFCGSYAYAAPEILTGTPYEPQKSDIWSMGVILYTMVFGRLPFDDSNHKQLLKQVHKEVTFPAKYEKNVSLDCRNLMQKKLLQSVKTRATLQEIRQHVWTQKLVMHAISTGATTSSVDEKMKQQAAKPKTSKIKKTASEKKAPSEGESSSFPRPD